MKEVGAVGEEGTHLVCSNILEESLIRQLLSVFISIEIFLTLFPCILCHECFFFWCTTEV